MAQEQDAPDAAHGTESDAEPDPRFTLANERTFLAWMRTGLALLAAAVALSQFATDLDPAWLREACAVALGVLATASCAGGLHRWAATQRDMRAGRPLHSGPLPAVLAAGLVVVGLALTVGLALARG